MIDAYDTFLRASCRRVVLSGHVGDKIFSTKGIPEGCTVAVFGMVVLSAHFIHVVETALPEAEASAYADNWGVTTTINAVALAVDAITQLCNIYRLVLATTKSCVQ